MECSFKLSIYIISLLVILRHHTSLPGNKMSAIFSTTQFLSNFILVTITFVTHSGLRNYLAGRCPLMQFLYNFLYAELLATQIYTSIPALSICNVLFDSLFHILCKMYVHIIFFCRVVVDDDWTSFLKWRTSFMRMSTYCILLHWWAWQQFGPVCSNSW